MIAVTPVGPERKIVHQMMWMRVSDGERTSDENMGSARPEAMMRAVLDGGGLERGNES
jgi:hypothetical protein